MGTTRRARAHKFTAECPNPKCGYTSRIPETPFHLTNQNSVHSQSCPKHRLALVRVVYEPKNTKAGRIKKWNDTRLYGENH